MKEYVILILLWIGWCILHSAMIATAVTDYLKSRSWLPFRFYRLFYTFTSIATLLPIYIFSTRIESGTVYSWQGGWQILRWSCLFCGLILMAAGAFKYDLLTFVGIRQIASGSSPTAMSESGGLDTGGVLGIVRHPWYLAALLLVWTWYSVVTYSLLTIQIVLTLYLLIGTLLEERKLKKKFGRDYRQYMAQVSQLFPLKWIRKQLR